MTADQSMATEPSSIRIMQFNIEYGGKGVEFSSVAKAIEAAGADVVAVQEGCATMGEIANDLRWGFWDARTQVVSKYPLLTPPVVEPGVILVELSPGEVFGLVNVHPASRRYGPTQVARGKTREQMVSLEKRVRLKELKPALASVEHLLKQHTPVILLGDFNAPSHRDWVPSTVGLRSHVKYPMPWPMSVAAESLGLTDVYRAIYPDPVERPGLTWPADRPIVRGYNPAASDKPADRIDLMYVGGSMRAVSIQIIGEQGSSFSDLSVTPWPTDHRALVAQFEVIAGTCPTLVSVDRQRAEIGMAPVVRYFTRTSDAARVALAPQGIDQSEAAVAVRLSNAVSGECRLSTNDLPRGAYDVLLLTDDGRALARTRLWLMARGDSPVVNTDRPIYEVGAAIEATWEFGPGNKSDWIAIFDRDTVAADIKPRLWEYVGGKVSGTFTFDELLRPRRWPLQAGDYSVRLMQDDSPISLAKSDFTIA